MRNSIIENKYVIFVMALVIAVLFILIFFKKDKLDFITNTFERSFNDTIVDIYSKKYKGTVVVATALKNCDTALLIDGVNDSLHLYLSQYSDEGLKTWEAPNTSLLIKKEKSDSFYLLRNNKMIGFRLIDKSYVIK